MANEIRIKYTDIMRTFSDILHDKFGLDIFDVIEDYPRACFMTRLEIPKSERFMTRDITDNMTMTIYYFPESKENNSAELLIMQEDLRDLFLIELNSLIPAHDRLSLEILELNSVVVDRVLQVSIDMSMNHRIIDDRDVKAMEQLEISKYYDDEFIGKEEYGKDDGEDG